MIQLQNVSFGYQIVQKLRQESMKGRSNILERLEDTNPYRIHLAKMLHNITEEIPMEMPDIVLI